MDKYTKVVILPFFEYQQLLKAAGKKINTGNTGIDLRQLLTHTNSQPVLNVGKGKTTPGQFDTSQETIDSEFESDNEDLPISKDSIVGSSLASNWETI